MAKVSAIENNEKRRKLVKKYDKKRAELRAITMDRKLSMEERFKAQLQLANLPRNGAKVRIRNRCAISGRPRGHYRKLNLSRIYLRQMGAQGLIPGLVKSSW
ncbi:30S ribosomal protein S14 [Candidatus Endowatersipora endosymbiont of Watersipora subatra]|uniref:30S ribosomal protein S14 n=1 Tax=Candidatus Endowatersipora endosymbiont of Watersipora subatra TaxID=3077946 RepID=UPI00312CB5C8